MILCALQLSELKRDDGEESSLIDWMQRCGHQLHDDMETTLNSALREHSIHH